MAFSPGDVVRLKSGGAAMTVVSESADGVHCIWHAEVAGDLKSGVIPAACLDTLELDDDIFDEDLDEIQGEFVVEDDEEGASPSPARKHN